MESLQSLFLDAGVAEITVDMLTTVKIKNLPDSDTGDLWAIGVEYNKKEYGGTVIVSEQKLEHMKMVFSGHEDFSATLVDGNPITII